MDEIRRMNELINISKMLPIMMRFNGELAKQSTLVIKIIEERKLKIATWNANGLLGKLRFLGEVRRAQLTVSRALRTTA
jgi:hypothetical protein